MPLASKVAWRARSYQQHPLASSCALPWSDALLWNGAHGQELVSPWGQHRRRWLLLLKRRAAARLTGRCASPVVALGCEARPGVKRPPAHRVLAG